MGMAFWEWTHFLRVFLWFSVQICARLCFRKVKSEICIRIGPKNPLKLKRNVNKLTLLMVLLSYFADTFFFTGERAISSFSFVGFWTFCKRYDLPYVRPPVLALSSRMKKWFLLFVNINNATWTAYKFVRSAKNTQPETGATDATITSRTDKASPSATNENERPYQWMKQQLK